MSLMAKAMGVKVGNSLRKLVLIKLADNANDKGECWPSYQHIADQCECSKSAVRNHIDALEEMGLVKRENRVGVNNGKGNTSNVYYLNLDVTPMPLKSTGVWHKEAPPMPPDGTPPMPPDGTRTSHSFEPVNEPLNTQAAVATCDGETEESADVRESSSRYAFEGQIVRLNHKDYQAWKNLYPMIDLNYELQKLDIEFTHEKPKNWFITASQKLSYQNKQAATRPARKVANGLRAENFAGKDYGHTEIPSWARD
ncbi:helix-turn-helix domain-containing protein [Citrobacter koseri]|uniref:helix-turn-helix domain-containing protein n=1 Tax=Citrobacter koseri TaxID=545 RepID=UPI001F3BCDCB|nr:helix-turn-helix domain-containing protein [Citrobacter koseri]